MTDITSPCPAADRFRPGDTIPWFNGRHVDVVAVYPSGLVQMREQGPDCETPHLAVPAHLLPDPLPRREPELVDGNAT